MAAIRHQFAGGIAMVSSFGADSAVLLHMVAQIDPSTPVVFVDTVKLFPATLYRDDLVEKARAHRRAHLQADAEDLADNDPAGMLWMSDTDACCHIRKVVPLERALTGFEAWISGRKRFQSSTRANLEVISRSTTAA
jgi:phosphoadenosine phosphosulfate reductase